MSSSVSDSDRRFSLLRRGVNRKKIVKMRLIKVALTCKATGRG